MSLRRAALLTIVLLAAGCKGKNEQPAASARAGAPKGPQAPPKAVFSEPEAVQVLLAFDSNRIASAAAARTLSQSDPVLEYVRVMMADHQAASRMIDSLLVASGRAPADNSTSQQIRQETQQFVTELLARDSGINNSYIAHELRDHEQALMLLDTALIPSAQDSALKTSFEMLRPMLEAHIQQARRIQAERATAARLRAQGITPPSTAPAPVPTPSPTTPATAAPPRPDTLRLLGRPVRPVSTTNM